MTMTLPYQHPFELIVAVLRARLDGRAADEPLRAALARPTAAWELLVAVGSAHHVLAAFAAAIADLQLAPRLEQELRDFLATLLHWNGVRNQAMRQQLGEVVTSLNGIGVEPVLLKGAIRLVDGLYPDPGWRMMGDLDLLVPRARRVEALAALQQAGYATAAAYRHIEPTYECHHHCPPMVRPDRPAPVELHDELFVTRRQRRLLPGATMLAAATPMPVDGGRARLPTAEHQLVHLIGHCQIADRGYLCGSIRLRDRLEAAALVRRAGAAFDAAALDRRFAAAGYRPHVVSFLLALGDGGLHQALPSAGIDPLTRLQARRIAWQARTTLPIEHWLRQTGRCLRATAQAARLCGGAVQSVMA